jgi:hypothetical protein
MVFLALESRTGAESLMEKEGEEWRKMFGEG